MHKTKFKITIFLLLFLGLCVFNFFNQKTSKAAPSPRIINIVAVEYKGKFSEGHPRAGQQVNAYRWDPGTIVVKQGEKVELRFFGVNGDKHDFSLEGYPVSGVVVRGEETIVSFVADKAGIFTLNCLSHPPRMTANLVVLPGLWW